MSEISVAIAIADQELRQQAVEAIQGLQVPIADDNCWAAELPELLANISRIRPGILLLGLPGLPATPEETLSRITNLESAPRIVAINDCAEPEIIVKAMRTGASEFVYPPFDSRFADAFRRVSAECLRQAPESRSTGSIIGFVSAKGGCGATTLACHASDFLRGADRKEVLLADLDFSSGMCSLPMQTAPRYTVTDALQNLHRLDLKLWKAMVPSSPSGVDVISAAPAVSDFATGSRKLSHLLRFWRLQYDYTIVDFGHGFNPPLAEGLDWIDTLVVVATNEVPALRLAKQLIQSLAIKNFGANRIRLVINRMPKRTAIQVPELERIISFPIYATVPNDYKALEEAYAEPRLLKSDSPLGSHMAQLAAKLAGLSAAEPKKTRKFSIFG